jgi:hypothetical protein
VDVIPASVVAVLCVSTRMAMKLGGEKRAVGSHCINCV